MQEVISSNYRESGKGVRFHQALNCGQKACFLIPRHSINFLPKLNLKNLSPDPSDFHRGGGGRGKSISGEPVSSGRKRGSHQGEPVAIFTSLQQPDLIMIYLIMQFIPIHCAIININSYLLVTQSRFDFPTGPQTKM